MSSRIDTSRAVAVALPRERRLGAALTPALLTMRAWRAAKRLRLVSSKFVGSPLHSDASGVAGGGGARSASVGLSASAGERR
jgi:hypothetical protein